MTHNPPMLCMAAVECPPLTVEHAKSLSTADSDLAKIKNMDITCDDDYEDVGTKAVCSLDGSGKPAWTNVPTCEGWSEG